MKLTDRPPAPPTSPTSLPTPGVLPVPGRRVLRVGPVSGAVASRAVAVGTAGLLAALALAVVGVGRGDFPIPPAQVLDVLAGGGNRAERFIVLELRLPRALCALLVGAALAVSGALTQTVARNALATPDILGVTSGAATGAVLVIVLGGSLGGAFAIGVPAAALVGAAGTAALIYLLAWRRGVDGYRLVLVGIAVGELLGGVTSWLLVKAELIEATQATIWLNGSLAGRDWSHVRPLAVALAVLLPAAVAATIALRLLQFGDDTARGLGLRVQRAQLVVVALAVALAAAAVAAAGPIEFVAFVVPQVALRLCGGSRPPLLTSAALGALLVTAADLAARVTPTGRELPVGLVTAMLGAPYLLWLLFRGTRGANA